MDPTFWRRRWQENRIGFHREEVHPSLLRYHQRFLAGGERVLVPLCGKSVDMAYLADRGFEVVGVEVVETAVQLFFAEQGRPASVENVPGARLYRADNLSVYCGNIFDLGADVLGTFDRIWDRAALVALEEPQRVLYTKALRALAGPGAKLLQSTLEYDQSIMEGPPWSVSHDELRELYAGLRFDELDRRDLITDEPRWAERGHAFFFESTHLIYFP